MSAAGRDRLLSVYGGRALELLDGVVDGALPAGTIDAEGRVLNAEVAWAFDKERAATLSDVVHRRLMLGLDADQGRALYSQIADLAAEHLGWDSSRRDQELAALLTYSDSFLLAG